MSTELGDNPQTAEGAEEQTSQEMMIKEALSAADILGNQEVADKWLKRVESDPRDFLRAKFQIQLNSPAARGTTDERGNDNEEITQ